MHLAKRKRIEKPSAIVHLGKFALRFCLFVCLFCNLICSEIVSFVTRKYYFTSLFDGWLRETHLIYHTQRTHRKHTPTYTLSSPPLARPLITLPTPHTHSWTIIWSILVDGCNCNEWICKAEVDSFCFWKFKYSENAAATNHIEIKAITINVHILIISLNFKLL